MINQSQNTEIKAKLKLNIEAFLTTARYRKLDPLRNLHNKVKIHKQNQDVNEILFLLCARCIKKHSRVLQNPLAMFNSDP